MRREFAMPDVGEGLTEAEILTWRVAPGDTVAVNQIIVEIETAKAAVELPSPYAGTVGELLAQPGETVAVGSPIIAIETAEAGSAAPAAGSTAGVAAAPAAPEERGAKIGEAGADGRIATLVGYGPRPGSVARRPRRRPDADRPAPAATAPAVSPPTGCPRPPCPRRPCPRRPHRPGPRRTNPHPQPPNPGWTVRAAQPRQEATPIPVIPGRAATASRSDAATAGWCP